MTAAARPAGPAPTTAILRLLCVGSMTSTVSWHALGLTRQLVSFSWKVWSRQAWLHAIHVLMRSALSAAALFTKSGSAKNGRAIDTMSAWPEASTRSATSGVLIRLLVTKGMPTLPLSCSVTQVKAPRGTLVAIVGIRASCQPIPLLRMVTPAASSACANSITSSRVEPPSTRSSIDSRKMMMKSSPTRSRTRRTISTEKRMRLA